MQASTLHSRTLFDPSVDAAFSADLRAEARDYLGAAGDHRYADRATWLKIACLALAVIASYWAALHALRPATFFIVYVGMHLFAVLLSVNATHDASHGALARSRPVNMVAMRLIALPLGNEPVYWQARHVRYHHPYANIEHYDVDTAANPFLRQTPYQAWFPWFRFQHLYWPVVAALSMLYVSFVYDWSDRLGKTPLAHARLLSGFTGWSQFIAGKVLHVGLFVALPLLVAGPHVGYGVVAAAWLVGQMSASCALITLLLGTHWADTAFFEAPAAGPLPHSRDAHAFYTCCDWRARPNFINAWLGGINYHLTHHLFPGYSHRHAGALAAIVARLAARDGLPYRCIGYRELFAAQQRFLKQMGTAPEFS